MRAHALQYDKCRCSIVGAGDRIFFACGSFIVSAHAFSPAPLRFAAFLFIVEFTCAFLDVLCLVYRDCGSSVRS